MIPENKDGWKLSVFPNSYSRKVTSSKPKKYGGSTSSVTVMQKKEYTPSEAVLIREKICLRDHINMGYWQSFPEVVLNIGDKQRLSIEGATWINQHGRTAVTIFLLKNNELVFQFYGPNEEYYDVSYYIGSTEATTSNNKHLFVATLTDIWNTDWMIIEVTQPKEFTVDGTCSLLWNMYVKDNTVDAYAKAGLSTYSTSITGS